MIRGAGRLNKPEPIRSCSHCGPYVWHATPEDCPAFHDGVVIPLRGEPWPIASTPLGIYDLYFKYCRIEQEIRDALLRGTWPFLFLPFDDTAEAIARMEDEGGPPC